MLREWLVMVSEPAIVLIDALALVIIVYATVRAFLGAVRLAFRGQVDGRQRREVWLDYGRWLVAGLTFQLAADIIESSVVPTWEAIGKLAAIAVVRTFLNYFLERDIAEIRERQRVPAPVDVAER